MWNNWRSFRHFGNYNYSLRKIAKNDKNGPKIEIPQILRCFLYIFRIYSLKIFAGGGLGEATAHSIPIYIRPWRDAIVFKAPVLPVMVNGGRFEL